MLLPMPLGKFITFEGGEGSGKSTQSKLLVEWLQQNHIDVVHTREPGGTEGAEAIRSLLVTGDEKRWDAVTELCLLAAARRDHVVKKISPALVEGKWVVCDRFIHSSLAYQGYGLQLGEEIIKAMHHLTVGRIQPCLTFLLDIDPLIGIRRALERTGNETRYEQMDKEFHHRLRQGFLRLAERNPERMKRIDATQPIATIHQKIIEQCKENFALAVYKR